MPRPSSSAVLRLPALGTLLVIAGAVTSFTGFVNGWEASIEGRGSGAEVWGITILLGLATMVVGAGIIVWRAVAAARRHGPLAAMVACLGGLGLVILLAFAAYAILAGGDVDLPVAVGLAVTLGVALLVESLLLRGAAARSLPRER